MPRRFSTGIVRGCEQGRRQSEAAGRVPPPLAIASWPEMVGEALAAAAEVACVLTSRLCWRWRAA